MTETERKGREARKREGGQVDGDDLNIRGRKLRWRDDVSAFQRGSVCVSRFFSSFSLSSFSHLSPSCFSVVSALLFCIQTLCSTLSFMLCLLQSTGISACVV
ncbi:hypothetical protein XENOCAPTIV_022376 [Xenoophorus captivus]|uniref:Transmembrane protein n=1 Tax=Xenoophorus captivus TaxID=1517983 RepID=A0ABV0QMK2_9TELE